jgi:hypothetical protein
MAKGDLMKDDGGGLPVAETNVTRRLKAATTNFEDNVEIKGPRPWVDVRAFGAVGDGTTNDAPAIDNAIGAAAALGGGTIFFPEGTYLIENQPDGIVVDANVILLGAGARRTTLRAAGTTNLILRPPLTSGERHIVIEDMSFDGATTSGLNSSFFPHFVGIWIRGDLVRSMRVSRCRFFNFDFGYGIFAQDAVNCVVDDCVFESLNPPGAGTALGLDSGIEDFLIDRCAFRYCYNGIIIGTGDDPRTDVRLASRITIRNSVFEGGWWTLPVRRDDHLKPFSGSAVFTDTSLTDATASFPAIGTYSTIRLMHQKRAGVSESPGGTYIQDSLAQFNQIGLAPGDIVRTGGTPPRFAVVSGVESTLLRVEEWLDDTTRQPVMPPPQGTPYQAFHVFLGRRSAQVPNTSTVISVERWHDLDGNGVGGAALNLLAGLTYEVLPEHPNYLLQAGATTRDIQVLNNVFRRGWADQCSVDGNRVLVLGNDIRDGQDHGVAHVTGAHTLISNNFVRHNGATGIESDADGTIISNNILSRNGWVVDLGSQNYAADIVVMGDSSMVMGNLCDGEDMPLAQYGITLISSPALPTTNATIADNKCLRHTARGGAGIQCYRQAGGQGPSGMKIWNNDTSTENTGLKHTNVTVGGNYQLSSGPDDPDNAVSMFDLNNTPTGKGIPAAPGSTYRKTGGAAPFFYVKESPANNPKGWVGK